MNSMAYEIVTYDVKWQYDGESLCYMTTHNLQ